MAVVAVALAHGLVDAVATVALGVEVGVAGDAVVPEAADAAPGPEAASEGPDLVTSHDPSHGLGPSPRQKTRKLVVAWRRLSHGRLSHRAPPSAAAATGETAAATE